MCSVGEWQGHPWHQDAAGPRGWVAHHRDPAQFEDGRRAGGGPRPAAHHQRVYLRRRRGHQHVPGRAQTQGEQEARPPFPHREDERHAQGHDREHIRPVLSPPVARRSHESEHLRQSGPWREGLGLRRAVLVRPDRGRHPVAREGRDERRPQQRVQLALGRRGVRSGQTETGVDLLDCQRLPGVRRLQVPAGRVVPDADRYWPVCCAPRGQEGVSGGRCHARHGVLVLHGAERGTVVQTHIYTHLFIHSIIQGAGCSSEVERSLMVRSILHGVDPLSYFLFQPVLHNCYNKGCGICYPVCGIVHIKEPLLIRVAYVVAAGFLSHYQNGP